MQARKHENSDEFCAPPVRHLDLATRPFTTTVRTPSVKHTVWGTFLKSLAMLRVMVPRKRKARTNFLTFTTGRQTAWYGLNKSCAFSGTNSHKATKGTGGSKVNSFCRKASFMFSALTGRPCSLWAYPHALCAARSWLWLPPRASSNDATLAAASASKRHACKCWNVLWRSSEWPASSPPNVVLMASRNRGCCR